MTAWKITRPTNQSAEILLYDSIGEDFGVEAKSFIEDLNSLGEVDEIDLRINSPGGSVFQGLPIYNALDRHPAMINVYIDGIALSMASGIAMAGDRVTMAENGLMMIHSPQGFAAGDSTEMLRTAEMLTKARDALARAYSAKSGKDLEEIYNLMAAETWFTAEEALEAGFVDVVSECSQKMAASYDADSVSVPSHLQGVFNSLTSESGNMTKTQTTAGVPAAATLQELKQLNNDNDFIVACLEGQMTLDQAREQLIVNQAKTIGELQDVVADLQGQISNGIKEDTLRHQAGAQIPNPGMAQREGQQAPAASDPPKADPAPAREPAKPKTDPDNVGNPPVGNSVLPIGTTTPQPAEGDFGSNPLAFFKQAKAKVKHELLQNGLKASPADLLREVHARYPQLNDALESYGAKRGAS